MPKRFKAITANSPAIDQYYALLDEYRLQRVRHEGAVSTAFETLLARLAKQRGWMLIPLIAVVGKRIVPDGTIRDGNGLPRAYWEAKDTSDDLDVEIRKKKAKGYPLQNIIFEDTLEGVLYQGGVQVLRVTLSDRNRLAQRVTQAATDNASLQPMVEAVEQNCDQKPDKVVADSGLYSNDNAAAMEQQGIDAYVPDSNMAAALNRGARVKGRARAPEMKRMRAKFRTSAGRGIYAQRKGMVEGVFGVLKSERDLHRFRLRSLQKVGIEFTLAAIGFNLTRLRAEQDQDSPLWARRRKREREKTHGDSK